MSNYGRLLLTLLVGGFVLYLLINGDLPKYVVFAKASS